IERQPPTLCPRDCEFLFTEYGVGGGDTALIFGTSDGRERRADRSPERLCGSEASCRAFRLHLCHRYLANTLQASGNAQRARQLSIDGEALFEEGSSRREISLMVLVPTQKVKGL